MANFGLIFKQRVRFGVNAEAESLPFGAVELDASIDESHASANEITQFPVETGVDIADHVRRQPDRLTIRGLITDHPITWGGAFRSDRSKDAFENVLNILNEAELITVVTSLRQYQNMILESVDVPRNSRLGHAVELSLSFREVLTAEVTSTAGTTDLGTQNTTVVT